MNSLLPCHPWRPHLRLGPRGWRHACSGTERGRFAEQLRSCVNDPQSIVAGVHELTLSAPIVGLLCHNVNSVGGQIPEWTLIRAALTLHGGRNPRYTEGIG